MWMAHNGQCVQVLAGHDGKNSSSSSASSYKSSSHNNETEWSVCCYLSNFSSLYLTFLLLGGVAVGLFSADGTLHIC